MQDTEKDTIDVITYLKKQDQEKDKQVSMLYVRTKIAFFISVLSVSLLAYPQRNWRRTCFSECFAFLQMERLIDQIKEMKKEHRKEKETMVILKRYTSSLFLHET